MTMLCENCDREILDNPSYYLDKEPHLGNKIKRYTINNIELDKIDEILNNYITIYNKDYDIFCINCKFILEFDNNFILNTETHYIHNAEREKVNSTLSFIIKKHKVMGYKIFWIKQMDISILIDRCNITYKKYIKTMLMIERRINFIFAKNPSLINLLDRNKNHRLIRKYSHIPFNNL